LGKGPKGSLGLVLGLEKKAKRFLGVSVRFGKRAKRDFKKQGGEATVNFTWL